MQTPDQQGSSSQTMGRDEVAAPAALFERYRGAIDSSLRASLDGQRLDFYDMLRYHLGLDADGNGAGKALRPTLCLLVCEALGGEWADALPPATAIELIHNFSLIHDDIQDGDTERRHRPALWTRWGVAQGINAGDAMFCMATLSMLKMQYRAPDSVVLDVIQTVQQATGEMIEGQYLDVSFEKLPLVSLEQYTTMIARKTGALLRASIEVGAMMAGATSLTRQRCRRLGEAIGRLFQIRDDMLGVWGEAETTGKPVSSDIRRKKKSMPIVLAMSQASGSQMGELALIYQQETLDDADVRRVMELFDELDVQARVQLMADAVYNEALSLARDIDFNERGQRELLGLIDFLLGREY